MVASDSVTRATLEWGKAAALPHRFMVGRRCRAAGARGNEFERVELRTLLRLTEPRSGPRVCDPQQYESIPQLENAKVISKPRAAPRPIVRVQHQCRFRRIVLDVTNRLSLMLCIAHV